MKRIIILVVFSFLVLSGCGVVQIDADPETYPVTEGFVPHYKTGQHVRLINAYDKPKIVNLYQGKLTGDLKQYTDTSIKLLQQGLAYRNIQVDKNAKKSVKLRVEKVVYDYAFWTIRADVFIRVTLGNGEEFVVTHHNASPSDGWRAVSGAIAIATRKILNEPRFIDYMNA